jgi:hypothetical protein
MLASNHFPILVYGQTGSELDMINKTHKNNGPGTSPAPILVLELVLVGLVGVLQQLSQ